MKEALLHFEFRGRMWIIAAIKTKTNHSHTRAAFVQHWVEEMESFDYISRNASGQRQIRDLTILFLLLNKTLTVFENNEKALIYVGIAMEAFLYFCYVKACVLI